MNAQTWIELTALIATFLGGGAAGMSKLTRVAVAIEQFGKALETLSTAFADTNTKVQAHAAQLAAHEARLNAAAPQSKP